MIESSCKCFVRRRDRGEPYGIWIMTGKDSRDGVFLNTARRSANEPAWTTEQLDAGVLGATQISPDEVIDLLRAWWPEAIDIARECF